MNILYYIPGLSQQMGGLRQYAVALLKILAKDTENRYFIYHTVNDPEVAEVLRKNPHLTLIENTGSKLAISIQKKLTGKTRDRLVLEDICKKHEIHLAHCPYQYLPVADGVRAVCTMHDVQEIHFPEYFSPEERAKRATDYLAFINQADRVIVSYQHIKNDLVKYFRVAPGKVDVLLLEMDNLWLDKYTEADLAPLTGLNLPDRFLFYAANTWAHKNHYKLLQALVELHQQGHQDIKLVFTGHQTSYYDEHLKPYVEANNLQQSVIFAGVVDEKTLYNLYKKCVGVVVPTLYEAGSFPLMEALLLSVPVICSNVTSLPETVGNAEFVFDPTNVADIAQKVKQLWEDASFREKSVSNGYQQAKELRNTNALQKIKDIYKAAAQ